MCLKCGYKFPREEMEELFKDFRCPRCGHKILKKLRREGVPKRVKAI